MESLAPLTGTPRRPQALNPVNLAVYSGKVTGTLGFEPRSEAPKASSLILTSRRARARNPKSLLRTSGPGGSVSVSVESV